MRQPDENRITVRQPIRWVEDSQIMGVLCVIDKCAVEIHFEVRTSNVPSELSIPYYCIMSRIVPYSTYNHSSECSSYSTAAKVE